MIETEKKYKLSKEQFEELKNHFLPIHPHNYVVEENSLYDVDGDNVLRVRKETYKDLDSVDFLLTFKGAKTVVDGIKSRTEIESVVDENVVKIIEAISYRVKLVYEKKRLEFYDRGENWAICLDELPFGYYMEIEGTEDEIMFQEAHLPFVPDVETYSYPKLTTIYGKSVEGIMEARF